MTETALADCELLLQRLRRIETGGQDGLGEYVADAVRDQVLSRMTARTRKILTPCLEHLRRAVELSCPAVMIPTPNGLRTGYGIMCHPNELCIALANRKHALVFTTTVALASVSQLPAELESAVFWGMLNEHLEEMAERERPHGEDLGVVAQAITGRLGVDAVAKLVRLTEEMHRAQCQSIMLVACVCGVVNKQAGGGLIVVPMSAIVMDEETP